MGHTSGMGAPGRARQRWGRMIPKSAAESRIILRIRMGGQARHRIDPRRGLAIVRRIGAGTAPERPKSGRNALRENKLRTLWKNGGVAVNGWLGIPSSASAESMARCGWDSLVVDLQHGLVDYTDAVPMLQAISQTDTTPMARVPWNMPDIIMKLLDAGAYGIVCPMINTPGRMPRSSSRTAATPRRAAAVSGRSAPSCMRAPTTGNTPTRRSSPSR